MPNLKESVEQTSTKKRHFRSKYFGLFIGAFLVLMTLIIWQSDKSDHLDKLLLNMESMAVIYANKIENRIDYIEFGLDELAEHGPPNTPEKQADWDMRTDFYRRNLLGIENIVWLDRDLIVRRVSPAENSDYVVDGEINASRQMTDYTSLVLPVYDQDMIAGFILCDINMPLLILSINDEFEGDYMIQVFDGDQLVASSEHWQQPKVDVSVESDISFKSRNYRFVLTPTETIISFSTRNSVWIAVFGLSLSVLVAAIWYATSMSSIRLEGLVAKRTKELNYLTNHDFLTDLSNRRYYYEQFKKLDQPAYYPIGIMMLDVNGLKIINDAFGHTVGDKALRMMGRILDDIFEGMDVVARIGGDEFAVLLPNSSLEKLEHYKETIKEAVKKHKINNIELSLAIGFELKNSTEEAIDDILKIAENHMYRHKTTEGSSVRNRAISAILKTLTDKYHIEREHAFRVSHLCKAIGQHLNLRDDELNELEQAGLLHDIGKISIPDVILNKPSKLTEEEFQIIKSHTEIGYQILKAADEYSGLAIHALHHHERWDGKGYPGGLKGKDIPLFSRIICIVDAYEAMTADRPYRKKMTKEYAISEIKRCSGTQFDPDLATKFIEKVLETQ